MAGVRLSRPGTTVQKVSSYTGVRHVSGGSWGRTEGPDTLTNATSGDPLRSRPASDVSTAPSVTGRNFLCYGLRPPPSRLGPPPSP